MQSISFEHSYPVARKLGFCVPGSVWCFLPELWMPISTHYRVSSKAFEASYAFG